MRAPSSRPRQPPSPSRPQFHQTVVPKPPGGPIGADDRSEVRPRRPRAARIPAPPGPPLFLIPAASQSGPRRASPPLPPACRPTARPPVAEWELLPAAMVPRGGCLSMEKMGRPKRLRCDPETVSVGRWPHGMADVRAGGARASPRRHFRSVGHRSTLVARARCGRGGLQRRGPHSGLRPSEWAKALSVRDGLPSFLLRLPRGVPSGK